MMELSGESPIIRLSVFSFKPERELALVVADDSIDICCGFVLAVSSDSRLLRYWS
jgi:hypothetical protein